MGMEFSALKFSVEPGLETVNPTVPVLQTPATQVKKGWAPLLLLFLLALALGLSARYALPAHVRERFEIPNLFQLRGIAMLFGAVAISIVLHEAGHLIAAILMNFKVLGLALGPFRVVHSSGRWEFRFTPPSLFSGSVSAIPRSTKHWRARMLVVVAGGPIATVVTGVAAGVLLLSQPADGSTNPFLGALTQLSLFIFVLGLIPNGRDARVRNDARLVLVLCRDSDEAREILLYHLLTQLEVAGTRPREYPERLMTELAQKQGRPDLMLFSAHKIVLWALDRGQLSTAEAWDRRCLELSAGCQPAARNVALANSACIDVLVRNRLLEAREKFSEVDWETLSPAWLMHRSRAAYYLTLRKVPECLAEISRSQYTFPNRLPFYVFERLLLSQLHRAALNVRPPELSKQCVA